MVKTSFKIMARIEIQRFNGETYSRDVELTTTVENAITAHLAAFLGITEEQAAAAIEQWRVSRVWLYEPIS